MPNPLGSFCRDERVLSSPITLTVHLRPDDYKKFRKYQRHTKGRTVPLGITGLLATLFELNENQPQKLTDEEILAILRREYPNKVFVPGAVTYFRHRFNAGEFWDNFIPEKPSFRYNSDGQRIVKIGQRLLPKYAEERTIAYHAKRRAEYEAKLKARSREIWKDRPIDFSI